MDAPLAVPIVVEGVWKTYGTRAIAQAAVRGLTLQVPPGSVYAFLGPNGAGKSTTIRMILGLQRPDRGKISLFGRPLESERLTLLSRIGSLVESPSLYLHLTGRENLEVHRRLLNISRLAVDEVLETVGLASVGDRLVRNYSSGMKQRLGIAQALLGNPELLVLDEPTNGLDPAGIHEMRELIRILPERRGVTVFLSSHLLSEVEQVATHFAIISQGQLKFEGTPEHMMKLSEKIIVIDADRPTQAETFLTRMGHSVTLDRGQLLIVPSGQCEPSQINKMLVEAGFEVSQLTTKHKTLEDVFLDLTSQPLAEMEHVAQ